MDRPSIWIIGRPTLSTESISGRKKSLNWVWSDSCYMNARNDDRSYAFTRKIIIMIEIKDGFWQQTGLSVCWLQTPTLISSPGAPPRQRVWNLSEKMTNSDTHTIWETVIKLKTAPTTLRSSPFVESCSGSKTKNRIKATLAWKWQHPEQPERRGSGAEDGAVSPPS